MIKRYYILICTIIILLLCTSCGDKVTLPARQPDGTFAWNGFELIREDLGYRTYYPEITVPENVITTKDRTLTLFLKSGGSDPYEYGTNEFIQVNLDGVWYTINAEISHRENPLILKESYEDDSKTEYMVDFSSIGELPVGKYRLVENFYLRRLQNESFNFAYFWVIKPNGKRPPESETTGKARKEDILISASSPYEARLDITDRDAWFGVFIENLSGKNYYADHTDPVLEIRNNGKWETIEYFHINIGLTFGWEYGRHAVFLKDFLVPGHYRIRIPMYTDEPGNIEVECEFDVLAYEDAPEPKWDISRLTPSPYDDISEKNTGIIMSVANPVLNENNTVLDITLTPDKLYHYGEYYETEVLLDGKWYRVPYAGMGFNDIGYTVDETENEYSRRNFSCDPLNACGIVPAGKYRIIKEFKIPNPDSSDTVYTVIAKEFAIAEFTVEQLFEAEPFFLGSASE